MKHMLPWAVFLFFYLHILQAFHTYRGKSAQKAMEERTANASESDRSATDRKRAKNKKKRIGESTGQMSQNVLMAGAEETDVLNPAMQTQNSSVFEIERSIILIHTKKVI